MLLDQILLTDDSGKPLVLSQLRAIDPDSGEGVTGVCHLSPQSPTANLRFTSDAEGTLTFRSREAGDKDAEVTDEQRYLVTGGDVT